MTAVGNSHSSEQEALAHGVVEAIADRTHRRPYARLTTLAKGQRSILAALGGVMNHGGGRRWPMAMLSASRTNSVRRWVAMAVADAAAESVEDHRQVEKARPSRNGGDVSHPPTVGRRGGEVAFDQLRRWPCMPLTYGRNPPWAATRTTQANGLHQARDPLTANAAFSRA